MTDNLESIDIPSHGNHTPIVDPQKKEKQLVKVFGWISFGLAILYFFGSFIGLFSSSILKGANAFSAFTSSEFQDSLDTLMSYSFYQALIGVLVSAVLIIGSIGYTSFNEWGRKMYSIGAIGAIVYNLFSLLVMNANANYTQAMMENMPGGGSRVFNSMVGTGMIVGVIFLLIPLTYLVLNIVIANKPKVKALMK